MADIYARSFTDTFGHLYPADELADFLKTRDKAYFAADSLCLSNACFLAEDLHGNPMGLCMMGHQDLGIIPDRPWWVLKQLYLLENAKGTGAGRALMEQGIAEARQRGAELLYLTVWVDNHRARRFYEKRGFVEIGKYGFQVGSTVDDDRIMRLEL